MTTFNDNESGASVRTKINAAITTVDGLGSGDNLLLTAAERSAIAANTAKTSNATHTGDVTGSTALTIADDAVTYAKMQNVSASDRLLGRDTSGAGVVEEIAPAAVRTMLNVADGATANTGALADLDEISTSEIATAAKTGNGTKVLTGTAGTNGQAAVYDGSGNLAGQDIETIGGLTSKASPVGADQVIIADSEASDAHKRATLTNALTGAGAAFSASPVFSGTITGTYTIGGTPTFPATVVSTTGTQTLTNKTLTAPKIAHPITTDADNYTLDADDQSAIIVMSGGSANQLTIPTNASVAFPLGTKVEVWSTGAGTTTIAGDTGVTLQGNGGSASAGACDIQTQYGGATLTKIATDTWLVGGDIDTVA